MKRLLLLVLLLAVAAGGYYYYTALRNSPTSALLQAAKATQTHDLATFERYVDVDAVTSGVVDDVAKQGSVLSALMPGGGLLLRGGLGLLKPQLAQAAHAEVQRLVETGSLEAARQASPKRLVNLSFLGLAGRLIGPDSQFKGIKYSTEQGDEARVGLEFTQPNRDSTAVVEVLLRKQPDGHWQAKRIANAGALVKQAARQAGSNLMD
ncbi:MAG: hypothetical protein EOO60_02615 [Hymenobacter sp.]|nr:MAG: hypothetical protein EOO60_02615 [Hymenobacter sp.]